MPGLAPKLDAVLIAAERVVWFDWDGNDDDAMQAMEALQVAVQEAKKAKGTQ